MIQWRATVSVPLQGVTGGAFGRPKAPPATQNASRNPRGEQGKGTIFTW